MIMYEVVQGYEITLDGGRLRTSLNTNTLYKNGKNIGLV